VCSSEATTLRQPALLLGRPQVRIWFRESGFASSERSSVAGWARTGLSRRQKKKKNRRIPDRADGPEAVGPVSSRTTLAESHYVRAGGEKTRPLRLGGSGRASCQGFVVEGGQSGERAFLTFYRHSQSGAASGVPYRLTANDAHPELDESAVRVTPMSLPAAGRGS